MTAIDMIVTATVALALIFWALGVRQQWSRNGSIKGMLFYALLFGTILTMGMLALYLLEPDSN